MKWTMVGACNDILALSHYLKPMMKYCQSPLGINLHDVHVFMQWDINVMTNFPKLWLWVRNTDIIEYGISLRITEMIDFHMLKP